MRTHIVMAWILTGLAVSCTRKLDSQPVHPAIEPSGSGDSAISSAENTIRAADDSGDLAQQLRDPNLLDRLDDPDAPDASHPKAKPEAGKPIIIKGSELPPEPIAPPRSTPQPPLEKPALPEGKDQKE